VEVTGPGLFENDDALALLGLLAGRDPAGCREVLAMILRHRTAQGLDDEAWLEGPGKIVAAVAVVAAGLAPGEAIARQIAAAGYTRPWSRPWRTRRSPTMRWPRCSSWQGTTRPGRLRGQGHDPAFVLGSGALEGDDPDVLGRDQIGREVG
jgi:hypothetical protein